MNEQKKYKDISVVSLGDKLVGWVGIATTILIFGVVLLVLGLQFTKVKPTDDDILVYVLGLVVLIIYFPFFVASIKKLIINTFKSIGRRLWLKKNNDGFPIDENNRFYKYINNINELRKPESDIIQTEKNVECIKLATYLNNMSMKEREYSNILNKRSSKLLKKINKRKSKNKPNEELITKLEDKYNLVLTFLEKTNLLRHAILQYDYDKIELLDSELNEVINITYQSINHEEIIHKTFEPAESDIFDRFINNSIFRKFRLYVLAVLTFAAFGYLLLFWEFDEFILDSYAAGYMLSVLLILLGKTKIIFTDSMIEFKQLTKLSIRYIDIIALYEIIKNRQEIEISDIKNIELLDRFEEMIDDINNEEIKEDPLS